MRTPSSLSPLPPLYPDVPRPSIEASVPPSSPPALSNPSSASTSIKREHSSSPPAARIPVSPLRIPGSTPSQRESSSSAPPPGFPRTPPVINLTAHEALLRECLLDCVGWMPDKLKAQSLTLRFSGGWVRDKLLGIQSHDIDVALSNMTGVGFAENLKHFMDDQGSKYNNKAAEIGVSSDLRSLHHIAANPEKSKHLETVTTKMFDLELDFVNLRKETYTAESRNPEMEFGTAEEDALRRDATVNALFYNLNTNQVEDFTKLGLDDLEQRLIRTPLPAEKTFEDDPLRILRLIRFACRLNFDMDGEAAEAMKQEHIRNVLRLKISRERIWTELEKMLVGPNPLRACVWIYQLGLYSSVFDNPNKPVTGLGTGIPVYKFLKSLYLYPLGLNQHLEIEANPEVSWILAAYTSYGESPAGAEALQHALKPPKRLITILKSAAQNSRNIRDAVAKLQTGKPDRSDWGMRMRQLGSTWPHQFLYALLLDFLELQPIKGLSGNLFGPEQMEAIKRDTDAISKRYLEMAEWLNRTGLSKAMDSKPIVNGDELQKLLGARPGRWMAVANNWIYEWQFARENPVKEEAIEMITRRRGELVRLHGLVDT